MVDESVLIPRPETEGLIEEILLTYSKNHDKDVPLTFAEVGVGSGCVLCSLCKELPFSFGMGLDISPQALLVAERNLSMLKIPRHRYSLVESNYFSALSPRQFSFIVSNPPYLTEDD